jgi:short-subunit dehydrogenase
MKTMVLVENMILAGFGYFRHFLTSSWLRSQYFFQLELFARINPTKLTSSQRIQNEGQNILQNILGLYSGLKEAVLKNRGLKSRDTLSSDAGDLCR